MAGTNAGFNDETTVANVTAKRPVLDTPATPGNSDGIIKIHGNAQDSFTNFPPILPLPIGILEQRLVAPGELFPLNKKRALRASSVAGTGINGTLAYDPVDATNPNGTKWTATYTGLTQEDIRIALGAESRGMWLGNANPPALETTVYETGALTVAGPAAPCTAPLEVLPPPAGSELVPPQLNADQSVTAVISNSNTVTLTWQPATDNVGVTSYGIYRNGQAIFTVQNDDGTAPAPITFVDPNTPPGVYTYQVKAFDEVGNSSGFSDNSNSVTAVQQLDVNTFPVNDPPALPINIIAFPSRDFISPSGYLANDKVTVQLLRRNASGSLVIISSAAGITPDAGFAEVNHPGGACWQGVTPEIRVGDVVRTIAYNPDSVVPGNPDGIRSIDQTTIAGVTAFQPVVVQDETLGNDGIVDVHGTAQGSDGFPLPIGQIEQRMISTHGNGLFVLNGRRALRAASAGGDGILSYDALNNPTGVNWTAHYSGLTHADIVRIMAADTRIHWLGRNPLLLNEATIFENAPGANPPGPAGPGCTRPLEAADVSNPSVPGSFSVALTAGNQANLNWSSSTDDWYVAGYRIFDNGIAVGNTGPTDNSFTISNITSGAHNFSVRAFDTASPRGAGADIIAQISTGLGNLYGNLSDPASSGTTIASDITAPSPPSNLQAISGIGTVTLTWTASNDNIGVDHYIVHRNPSMHGSPADFTVVGTTFTDGSEADPLRIDTYGYTIEAVDAADNHSAQTPVVTVTITETIDITAPTIPSNVTAVNSPDIHGKDIVLSWTAATDPIVDELGAPLETSGVSGYGIYRSNNGAPATLIASVNSATLSYTDLNPGAGSFNYTVDAVDSAGNRSAQSSNSLAVVAADVPLVGHNVIAFPARDFISATGYNPTHTYSFSLIRGGTTYTTDAQLPNAAGTIEANHPAAAPNTPTCWITNTPDMRAGDVIRIIDNTTGIAEQTTVANVKVERPVAINANTVIIRGTAQQANGTPIPLDQIEHRLVTGTANSFDLNGRRTLRAGLAGDGTIVYDTVNNPTGTKWTATYTGLTSNDVLRVVGGTNAVGTVFPGAESHAVWLGRDPVALTEGTIFENGTGVAGGPVGTPCTAFGETPVAAASFAPASIAFPGTSFSPLATSAALTVTFSNGGGSAMTLTNLYFAGLNPGDFIRPAGTAGGSCPSVFPANLAAGTSCTVNVQFRPTAFGLRQANLSFTGNAANTTDLTVPLTGNGTDTTDPRVSVAWTTVAGTLSAPPVTFGTVNGGASTTRVLTVTNTGTGSPLTVTGVTSTGTAAADYTVTGNTCASVNAGANCTITVNFRPGGTGARAASLVLAHNRSLPSSATSTTVAVSGTGGTGSILAFTSNPITYGTVTRNTSKTQTATVKNNSSVVATFGTTPKFTVTGAGFTFVSSTCGATLAANGTCSVVVNFTAPNTVGAFVGSLSVNNTNGLPVTVTTSLSASTK